MIRWLEGALQPLFAVIIIAAVEPDNAAGKTVKYT
jgi:hypothetical protein